MTNQKRETTVFFKTQPVLFRTKSEQRFSIATMEKKVLAKVNFLEKRYGDKFQLLAMTCGSNLLEVRCNFCFHDLASEPRRVRCKNCADNDLPNIAKIFDSTKTYLEIEPFRKASGIYYHLKCIHGKVDTRCGKDMRRRNSVDCLCTVKERRAHTCRARYGETHPMQNDDIAYKSFLNAKRFKEYKYPSGEVIKYQGFENRLLDILVNKFPENQIKTGKANVKTFRYNKPSGRIGKFYPDAQVGHTIYEVKSYFTYFLEKQKTEAKMRKVAASGYTGELYVFDDKNKVNYTRKVYKPNGRIWVIQK